MRIFVTGGSGWIGSAVVPELLEAGHEVVGLARSDTSAEALSTAGAAVHRGSLDDLDALGSGAARADGVIHLAFKHEEAFSGDFATATNADRRAIEVFGEALAGSERPLVIASGLAGLRPGDLATEDDVPDAASPAGERSLSERAALALADRGIRSSSVRLPPTVHGEGDSGFVARLVGLAREHGTSGYIGDGANRWPAVHRFDAARLFRLAAEGAPAGSPRRSASASACGSSPSRLRRLATLRLARRPARPRRASLRPHPAAARVAAHAPGPGRGSGPEATTSADVVDRAARARPRLEWRLVDMKGRCLMTSPFRAGGPVSSW